MKNVGKMRCSGRSCWSRTRRPPNTCSHYFLFTYVLLFVVYYFH